MSLPPVPGYQLESRLGGGAFGAVYRAFWNGDFPCALKVLDKGGLHRDYLADVLERLLELEPPPGLLTIYAFDLEGDPPHLSMALLPEDAVTFDDLAGQLTRDEAWKLLGQLAESLAWLHDHGLVHAGLTGGNVFVVADAAGEPSALLADVGQAWLGYGSTEQLHDQAPYVPPERWRDPARVLADGHAETWDVYAFGVLAWRLLNGRWPRANKLFSRVLTSRDEPLTIDPPAFAEWLAKEHPPVWRDEPRDEAGARARAMVLRCLSLDPTERPASMSGVAAVLREFARSRAAAATVPLPTVTPAPVSAPVSPVPGGNAPVFPAPVFTDAVPPFPEPLAVVAETAPAPVVAAAADSSRGLRDVLDRLPEAVVVPAPAPADPEATAPTAAPLAKPDFSGIFSWPEPGRETAPATILAVEPDPGLLTEAPGAGQREADAVDAAGFTALVPLPSAAAADGFSAGEGASQPTAPAATGPVPAVAARRRSLGIGGGLAIAASVAMGLGGGLYALQQRDAARLADAARAKAEAETRDALAAVEKAEAHVRAVAEERASSQLAGLAASRQEAADLAASVQTARPVEPAARKTWMAAAAPVAERLKLALAATDLEPSLLASGMNSRWLLAELYESLAKPEEALPLLEQLGRDLEAAAAINPVKDEATALLTARVAARRGAILLESRRTMEAAPLLQEASAGYESWLATHSDREDIAREFARISLLEGRALNDRQQPDAARAALTRVAGLLGKPEDGGFTAEDHFTLTDSLLDLAAMDSAAGKLEEAIRHHMQAVKLLVAYDQQNRQSVPCRRRLAEGYFGLGSLLTKHGAPSDASVAFTEAVNLLTELSTESPGEPYYRLQLALTYNEVAQLVRISTPTAAGAKEALTYQNGSVTILRNLNEAQTLDNNYRRHLAAALVLNAELHELGGDQKTSLARHTEALALLEELLAETTLADHDRKECRRLAARAWTALGGLQEKAGKKEDAIASLNKALEAWSGFAGEDPAADQIVASTKERLRKLQPGS